MAKISLKTCPKVYILETHRSKTPESTLRFIEKVKETAGMLSFRNASDVDRIGISVFTCDRIRPDGSKTSHTGKGVSPIQAQVSITMEAIERYCSEFREEYGGKLVRGSFARLEKNSNVLDPQELILSRLSNYQHDKEIDWIWGHDLSKDEEILVPACAVYHPFHQDDAFLFSTHTNGIAAGNTYEEAIIHGLAELIERDAWSIARYTHNFNDALFLEDEPGNRFIINVLERFEKAEIEIVTKDLTTDLDVPVVAAFSRDLVYREMFPIDGFGAHLDPRVAMVRSLLEIATTRALFLQKYGLEGLCETSPLYLQQGEGCEDDPRFYAHHQKSLRELDRGYSDDILQDVRTMIARLSARGLHRVIAVDLWRDDIGMPTVRMIVPGLEIYCFDQTRTGKRADQFLAE